MMLCHSRGPKFPRFRKKNKPESTEKSISSDDSARDSGISYDEMSPTSNDVSEKISEPDKPLLATKYTQRDKSLRLNHGGWDRNEKAEKEFSEPVYPSINEVLRLGGPYPQTIRSSFNDFWFKGFHDQSPFSWVGDKLLEAVSNQEPPKLEEECEEITYRKHFIGKEHLNFFGRDEEYGPIILSVKVEEEEYRVIIRCRDGNFERKFKLQNDSSGPLEWAKSVVPMLTAKGCRFNPVLCINAWQRIVTFDEHANKKKNHKFAVFLQKFGQTTEDELLSNSSGNASFQEFISFLGEETALKDHNGFRGGLTPVTDGDKTVFTKFDNREIMFHVSTLLPTDPDDKQQVAKKRHLGNDVVAVVFQERNTPFCPSLMQTKVTHCYIVVQPMDVEGPTQYKISVCCRKDVPDFGPKLPDPPVFKSGAMFRKYLLCKLINAENACYSSCEFNMLRRRNRSDLIETLYNELSAASDGMTTKRSPTRPLHTNKSFFHAIQQNNQMRRLSSHSSENSSESMLIREQNRKIIRRSGIRRDLAQKYNLQKMNDSGISSRESSSENESPAEEISDAITDRDMDSIKSEMLSFDYNEKTSLKSFSPSLGTLSMQINSIKIGGSSDDSGQDSEEIFIDDLVTSVTNATTLTTFSSADLKPNRAPLPVFSSSLPKSESSQLTTVSNFALPAVTVTSSPISKTAVNFPSVPKTLAPFKPTAPAKTTVSACANFSVQKTGQVNSKAVTSTTVKQLPSPITKSTQSPSTVTVVDKSQLPITVNSTVINTKPIISTSVNYDYGYEPSYYYENEVSVISEISSVASVPEPTSADRKLPPGAVPMPHMQQW